MKLTLDALLVLEAIHRKGSFAAAADELHRVRSALTYTIQKLESDLGVILFDRSQHKAKLTPAGETLLQEGKYLLNIAYDLERVVKRVNSGWEEELSIAIDDTISIEKLYPLIEQFYKECPYTRLKISTEILSGCWDALVSGRADLSIGVSGEVPPGSKYGIVPLGQIKFVFAVAPHHPLAKLAEPLKSRDIAKYRAVVAADTSRVLPPRSSGTLLEQDILTVPSIHSKIQVQILGLGVGFLPLNLIHDHIKEKKLVIKKVEKAKGIGNFSTAWRLDQVGKALEWFLEKLKDSKVCKSLFN